MKRRCGLAVLMVALGAAAESAAPGGPAYVDITWMSISNLYYDFGSFGVLTDGYITRIPQSEFYGGGGGLASTRHPRKPDVPAITRVMNALGGASKINLLLTGHSHFDHSFDTGAWSRLTGAPIIGSQSTCFQAIAQGIPAARCRAVNGGEKIAITTGVTMRVVRWNHSGDATRNPEQHNPVELKSVPVPDAATGGLRAGVAEDFPNGGGNRGYLFTVEGPKGRFSWFFQNSASDADLRTPIVIDGKDYGAPLENLKAAMKDAGLESVDLWIGSGGARLGEAMLPVIHPKAYLPVHWDGLWGAFNAGVPRPYADRGLEPILEKAGVKAITPAQYMDKWRLDASGISAVDNRGVQKALGFAVK